MCNPFVSLIIINYNGLGVLGTCVKSALNSYYEPFEVIVVDNGSTDGSIEQVATSFPKEDKLKIVFNKSNVGYVGINSGVEVARGKYIVFLNSDTAFEPDWITRMVAFLESHLDVGCAQPKVLVMGNPTIIENVGLKMDCLGFTRGLGRNEIDYGQYDALAEPFAAQGAVLIVRRTILNEVGLFDPSYFFNHEDVDMCWRIRLNGYRIALIPDAIAYHSLSRKTYTYLPFRFLHMRKNRLATLIKNYSLINLIKILPPYFFLYFLMFLKELFLDKKIKYAMTIPSALIWNLKNLRNIIMRRFEVQNRIRRVNDSEITAKMVPLLAFQILG